MPPGIHQYSVIVSTPQREMKFTAPTKERHDIWFNVSIREIGREHCKLISNFTGSEVPPHEARSSTFGRHGDVWAGNAWTGNAWTRDAWTRTDEPNVGERRSSGGVPSERDVKSRKPTQCTHRPNRSQRRLVERHSPWTEEPFADLPRWFDEQAIWYARRGILAMGGGSQ